MISGARVTKGLPDILIFRMLLGYLRANVYLSAPANLMDRRKHLIFFSSYPDLFSMPQLYSHFVTVYVMWCMHNLTR